MQKKNPVSKPAQQNTARLILDELNKCAPPDDAAMQFLNTLHETEGIAAVAHFFKRNLDADGKLRDKIILTKREIEIISDQWGVDYFKLHRRAFGWAVLAGIGLSGACYFINIDRTRHDQISAINTHLQEQISQLDARNLPKEQHDQTVDLLTKKHQAKKDIINRRFYNGAAEMGIVAGAAATGIAGLTAADCLINTRDLKKIYITNLSVQLTGMFDILLSQKSNFFSTQLPESEKTFAETEKLRAAQRETREAQRQAALRGEGI